MSRKSNWQVGQYIQLNDGRVGKIRFVGNLHFTTGEWIGIELDNPSGKNDGSAKGERYFECAPGYGMFLKPSMIACVAEKQPRSIPRLGEMASPQLTNKRPSSGLLSSAPSKSPTKSTIGQPFAGESSTDSPLNVSIATSKILSQPSSSSSSFGRSHSTIVPQSTESLSRGRSAMANFSTSKNFSGRMSSTYASPLSDRTTELHAPRISTAGTSTAPSSSVAGQSDGERTLLDRNFVDTTSSSAISASFASSKSVRKGSLSSNQAVSTKVVPGKMTLERSKEEVKAILKVDELQIKLRLIEKKRQEDREKLKALDRLRQDKEKFEIVIQKLRAKYQPLQNELIEAKEQLDKADEKLLKLEKDRAEHDTAVEIATLDREMAEEMTDACKSELEIIKKTLEEAQLENDILREENEELGKEMSPEEKSSVGWLQMEKENERLRGALLRLRELTMEQECELRRVIAGLEDEVITLNGFKEQHEEKNTSLQQAHIIIEDLKMRLDAALGAEEVIEELTEKNLVLVERIEELQATVEDLQSLKELNDELEMNHIEHGKQLQETIDLKDDIITQQSRKALEQDNMLAEHQYITNRFKTIVSSLQLDLENMRMSKELTETEAQELNSRTRAVMDINMKLQSSAAKGQARLIDLKLKNLDAEQAMDCLAMIQPYLPEGFSSEKSSLDALLQLKRVSYKAKLIHTVLRENFYEDEGSSSIDNFCASFTLLLCLLKISSSSDDLVYQISTCSTDQFLNYNGISHELDPIERLLNEHTEKMKKEELDIKRASEELGRSETVLVHLTNQHSSRNATDHSFDAIRRTRLLNDQLVDFISALSLLCSYAKTHESEGEGYFNVTSAEDLVKVVSNFRSIKLILDKTSKLLDELYSCSLSLSYKYRPMIERCEHVADQISGSVQQLGSMLLSTISVHEIRSSPACQPQYDASKHPSDAEKHDILSLLRYEADMLKNNLAELEQFSRTTDNTAKFNKLPAPWNLRAKRLYETKFDHASIDDEMAQLRLMIADAASNLIERESALNDATVKIELLEARAKNYSMKVVRCEELEIALEQYRLKTDELTEAIDGYKADLATLADERNELQRDIELRSKHHIRLQKDQGDVTNGPMLSAVQLPEQPSSCMENTILRAALKYFQDRKRRSMSTSFLQTYNCTNPGFTYSRSPLITVINSQGLSIETKMSEVWLEARLLTGKKSSTCSSSIVTPVNIINTMASAYPGPFSFPTPIMLPSLSDPRSRQLWQPFKCTSISRLLNEENKLAKMGSCLAGH